MDSYNLKKQLLGEIQEASQVTELNIELMEHLNYTARWLINYSIKNDIKLPDLDKLQTLIHRYGTFVQKVCECGQSSDESIQQDNHEITDGKDTEPYIT
jgi:hypothetical protein